jgi:hypothetical protein
MHATDCNHTFKQTVQSYRQPHATGFFFFFWSLLWDIPSAQNEALEMNVCVGGLESFCIYLFYSSLWWLQLLFCVQVVAQTLCVKVKYFLNFTSQLHCCHSWAYVANLLLLCTTEEQHPVIWFVWAEGVPRTEVHCQTFKTGQKQRFTTAKRVRKISLFKNGHTNVTGDEWSWHESTFITRGNKWIHTTMVLESTRLT